MQYGCAAVPVPESLHRVLLPTNSVDDDATDAATDTAVAGAAGPAASPATSAVAAINAKRYAARMILPECGNADCVSWTRVPRLR